jgi:hypothetical protein
MEKMGIRKEMKIMSDDDEEFNYIIVQNQDINDLLGCSIATVYIEEAIHSGLKRIKEEDILKIKLTKTESNDLYCCNMGIESLIGKYYDSDGFIYYNLDGYIYRFHIKINYFKKIFELNNKCKINGA